MAYSLNRQELIGRVGHTPELKYTADQVAIVRLSVATTERYKEEDKTTWHTVIAWKKLAEYIADKVPKGALVFVAGPTNHREWEGKEGQKRTATEVTALEFQLLSVPDGTRKAEPGTGKEVKPNAGATVAGTATDDEGF